MFKSSKFKIYVKCLLKIKKSNKVKNYWKKVEDKNNNNDKLIINKPQKINQIFLKIKIKMKINKKEQKNNQIEVLIITSSFPKKEKTRNRG